MCRRAVIFAVFALVGLAPATAQAATGDQAVYDLVHGCYGLRSVDAGKFVVKGADGSYAATSDTVGGAEPFRMQATTLGQYLLFGRAQDFLAVGSGDAVSVATQPGPSGDWKVSPSGGAFRLAAASNGRSLAVGDGGKLRTVDGAGGRFTFEQAGGCATFPEAEVNISGDPTRGQARFGEVRGLADLHMHWMAYEFLGGRAHCGAPWSPYGITVALVDCPDHEPNGAGAVLEHAVSKDEPLTHDTDGWPTFKGWPTYGSLTHEQTYYKWVERAWRGGLRVFVNLLVENKVLCEVYPLKKNSCNEMDSVRLQAKRIRELEAYVDAQNGGPGKGWLRIVKDPFEAREVINDGKLAVILGIEVSQPFDCRLTDGQPTCDRAQIERQLNEVYDLGVRDMELVNKFDNALAGVAGDNGSTGVVVNNGNKLETGSYWRMETCKGPPDESDREQPTPFGHNHDDLIANGLRAFTQSGVTPLYGPAPHCNTLGLSELGDFAVNKMIDKRMIIDPDHLSVLARKQLLPILEQRRYSGVVSSHSWSTVDAFPRIYKLGGMITPYAGSSTSFVDAWKKVKPMRDDRFFFGFGYGADMNGFGKQGPPRKGAPNPVTYPFKAIDPNVTVERNRTGTRTWDINTDGVAHYGLYPDWIEDLRKIAGDEIVEDMARGAEAYLQMWERTEGVPMRRCVPARSRLTRRGLGDVQVGRNAETLLRRAGQPDRRPGRAWTFCARDGVRERSVTAVLSPAGRVTLVGSKLRRHKASGIGIGDRVSRLRRKSGVRRVGSTMMVRRLRGGNRFVWGVRKGRVRWTAVASGSVAKRPAELRRAVRAANLR